MITRRTLITAWTVLAFASLLIFKDATAFWGALIIAHLWYMQK